MPHEALINDATSLDRVELNLREVGQLFNTMDHSPFSLTRESLTIAGRVAMWRPMQIYLYDWWPLRRRGRIYERLSRMPVEVCKREGY